MTERHTDARAADAAGVPRPPNPRAERPLTLTIFGATGDLTHRKLMPSLFAMYTEGLLPDEFAILGFARRDYTDERFRAWMAEDVDAVDWGTLDLPDVAASETSRDEATGPIVATTED